MQDIVQRKKVLKKVWDESGEKGDKRKYQAAKRVVAAVKDKAWDKMYEDLDTSQGEKKLFRLV